MNAISKALLNNPLNIRSVEGDSPSVFTDIYQDDVNIAVWRRSVGSDIQAAVSSLIGDNENFQISMTISGEDATSTLKQELGDSELMSSLSEDIGHLVEMFCCLFELERAGLRLAVLQNAMCPKFHVDRVPCRLVTTYCGPATDWLPHETVDRSKLGHGSGGLPDSESGLFKSGSSIRQMNAGDVALLKGESWEGNEGAGLVHRSPSVESMNPRLLLTLDFSA